MLLRAMIKKIERDFPKIKFTVNERNHLISIPAMHNDVGTIDIQDDFDELLHQVDVKLDVGVAHAVVDAVVVVFGGGDEAEQLQPNL